MKREHQFENKENHGNDVSMVIDLVRHAEKNGADGPLTPKGIEDAKSFGGKLREEFPDSAGIKVYHSGIERARQTAEAISGGGAYVPREKQGLGIHGKFSSEVLKEFKARVTEDGNQDEAVQWYLDFGDKRPDATTLSSKEASREFAQEILHLIEMSKELKEHSKINIVMVSHAGLMEHFMVDVLKADRKDFIPRIGGGVNYLEGLRMVIHRLDPRTVTIKVSFRGREVELSEEELREI